MLALLGSGLAALILGFIAVRWPMSGVDDFQKEAWPSFRALNAGQALRAVELGPGYVGSLLLRSPFALIAGWLGGGERAVFFAAGLPCLVAATVLGAWLSEDAYRRTGVRRLGPLVVCAVNPVVLIALFIGHPEEILGASLLIAAILLGERRRPVLAGLLVGLAVVNKTWGLAAAPAVLVTLPEGRGRAAITAAVTTAGLLGPLAIIRDLTAHTSAQGAALGGGTGTIFLQPQLLWWLGRASWISQHAHELIIVVGWAACGIWWLLRDRRRQPGTVPTRDEALLLLAFVMLLRCALDPWDATYYHVPFLFAIMAYETGRTPRLTALLTLALMIAVPPQLFRLPGSGHAILYAVFAVPTLLVLAGRVYLPRQSLPTPYVPTRTATA